MNPTKKILISGGASGIGRDCATHFAALGYQVALLDRNPKVLEVLEHLAGTDHAAFAVDATDYQAVVKAVAEINATGQIDHVLVSAGIVSTKILTEISPEEFATVMNVNVLGVQHVLAPVIESMLRTNTAGSAVVLSSVAAFNGGGLMGRGAYATSKSAIAGMVRSYARETAGSGIRVNAIAPGATETPMTADLDAQTRRKILSQTLTGRFLETAEIISVIDFLLGSGSSAINGQTIHANAGVYFG